MATQADRIRRFRQTIAQMATRDVMRLRVRIFRAMESIAAGGLSFGMDWNTMRIITPDLANRLAECDRLIRLRLR
jgi:hypothetical protein